MRKLEVVGLVKGLNTRLRQNHGKIYISYDTKIGFKQRLGLILLEQRVKDRVLEEGYEENKRRKERNNKRRMSVLG